MGKSQASLAVQGQLPAFKCRWEPGCLLDTRSWFPQLGYKVTQRLRGGQLCFSGRRQMEQMPESQPRGSEAPPGLEQSSS